MQILYRGMYLLEFLRDSCLHVIVRLCKFIFLFITRVSKLINFYYSINVNFIVPLGYFYLHRLKDGQPLLCSTNNFLSIRNRLSLAWLETTISVQLCSGACLKFLRKANYSKYFLMLRERFVKWIQTTWFYV